MKKDNQQLEEEGILKRYLNGDSRAFGKIYYRYRKLFFWHLNRKHSHIDHEEKEDLALEFLGRMSGQLEKYDSEKSLFRTWMTRCIINFIGEWRNRASTKKKRITYNIEERNSNGDYWDPGERYEALVTEDQQIQDISYRNILKRIAEILDDDDWKIFELHFLQGYTQYEVGERLGLRKDTMWYRVKKIREKLKDLQDIRNF